MSQDRHDSMLKLPTECGPPCAPPTLEPPASPRRGFLFYAPNPSTTAASSQKSVTRYRPRRKVRRGQSCLSYATFSKTFAISAAVKARRAALPLLAPNPRARGALGDQTDPLEPAGRRFGNFVFAIFPLGANDGARAFAANVADDVVAAAAAAPGARRVYQPRGHHGTRGTERSAVSSPVILVRADSSCARGAPDPRSGRPARAGWAALRQFRFRDIPLGGERWSSGVRGERC